MKIALVLSRSLGPYDALYLRLETWLHVFEPDDVQVFRIGAAEREDQEVTGILGHRIQRLPTDQFKLKAALNQVMSHFDVVVCLDFKAVESIVLGRAKTTIVCDVNELPTCTLIDAIEPVNRALLASMIEREIVVLRHCNLIVCPSLAVQQVCNLREVSADKLIHFGYQLSEPVRNVSAQTLLHIVFQQQRIQDSQVILAALKRLRQPWRLSVLLAPGQPRHVWAREPRVTMVEIDNWEAVIKTAWIAIIGGAESKHAECGLELPFLALRAPTVGVPVLGIQNSALRLCLGVADLLPPDRPDLLCEAIEQLTEAPNERDELHFSVVRQWQKTRTKTVLKLTRTHLFRQLFEKHDDNG